MELKKILRQNMYSRIVQVRGSTCDWHEVALRRRHRGDPQGDGAWELQHDQGVSHNNWAWLINILQCILSYVCTKMESSFKSTTAVVQNNLCLVCRTNFSAALSQYK